MSAHAPPVESQRFHWYAYEVGLPLHEPVELAKTCEICAEPLICGGAALVGTVSTVTVPVAADVADADPLAFVAVTVRRSVAPPSAETSAYEDAVAPIIEAQLAPDA